MPAVFLHGGGDNPDKRHAALNPFLSASHAQSGGQIALVVAEKEADPLESFADYRAIFESLGVSIDQLTPVLVTPENPLTRAWLEDIRPSGVFVCGGVTPFYHGSVCATPDWVGYLTQMNIPYGGTSAGAAIASQQAILGGWQTERGGVVRDMLFIGASEGLNPLTVRPGLGLVPFAVEVHASQMGTLTRLIHAVELGLVTEGWAIDENTMLEVVTGELQVYGSGHATFVSREGDKVTLSIHTAG
jgi:cyanophycinase